MARLSVFLQDEIARRGWSVEDFARRSAISLSLAYQIIRDGHDNIRQDTLSKIAAGLDMVPADVLVAAGHDQTAANTQARAHISAGQQTLRAQLERWVKVLGPRMGDEAAEDYFWDSLKRHTDSMLEIAQTTGSAVSEAGDGAVSAAVSRRARRGRRGANDGDNPLVILKRHTAALLAERHPVSEWGFAR